MKTTKTIAAVLAVFLVAVLFMGAASAAPAAGDVVYVYQYGIGAPADTYYLWVSGAPAGSVTLDATGTLTGEGITEGIYATTTLGTTLFSVKYPAITLNGYLAGTGTSISGMSLLKSQKIDFAVSGNNGLQYGLSFTTPAGGTTNTFGNDGAAVPTALVFADSSAAGFTLTGIAIDDVKSGSWSVVSKLLTGAAATKMIDTTPSKYISSAKLTFTVGSTITDAISISKEKVVRGSSTLITITGTPSSYVPVTVNAAGLILHAGQSGVIYTPTAAQTAAGITAPTVTAAGYVTDFWVQLSSSGSRTVQLDSDVNSDDKSYTITAEFSKALTSTFVALLGSDKNVKYTLVEGVVTANGGQDSYYLGNDITLSGTNTESDLIYLFIKGSNVERTYFDTISVASDDTWTTTFDPTVSYGSLDAGTYTFYASANADAIVPAPFWEFNSDYVYATVSVALKQPFLTATAASSVVAKGDKIEITGVAEATSSIRYYVFGNNKYLPGTISVDTDGTYSADIPTVGLDAGQYFVVIQHPMYDATFNVADLSALGTGMFYSSSAVGGPIVGAADTLLVVDVATRQSANAAEALCVAIDAQSIDDIYVKLAFIVAQPTITMNSVSDVTKGSALKISGTTNLKEGTLVTVDVLSTAFTAMEKTSVNSASFITLTTKVVKGTDGVNTWEVTFDTTGLNVDSYTIQAATEDLTTSTVIKVLEAKPTATATATATKTATATATATATPTKTPGFGAFLALAGLGAVAVLVLRRD